MQARTETYKECKQLHLNYQGAIDYIKFHEIFISIDKQFHEIKAFQILINMIYTNAESKSSLQT
jgi:hypothetical protein